MAERRVAACLLIAALFVRSVEVCGWSSVVDGRLARPSLSVAVSRGPERDVDRLRKPEDRDGE